LAIIDQSNTSHNQKYSLNTDYSRVEIDERLLKFRCGRGDIEDLAFGCMKLILVIHESRLLQMQGAGHEAVVFHRECPATKQML